MHTLTYIGFSIAPYGCSVITTLASQDNPGTYVVGRVLNKNFATYKGILNEITDALKIREMSLKFIEEIKNKAQIQFKRTPEQMRKADKNFRYIHHYSIVTLDESNLKNEIEQIDVKYTDYRQFLSFKLSPPKTDIKNSLAITSALINDGMVQISEDLNLTEIKEEIDNLKEPENFNKLSPQLTALSLSLGEAEYRRLSNDEDIPMDIEALCRGIYTLIDGYNLGFG